jgi:hypothetical protein
VKSRALLVGRTFRIVSNGYAVDVETRDDSVTRDGAISIPHPSASSCAIWSTRFGAARGGCVLHGEAAVADQSRERNPFWKGGRVVASNGYVLIRVDVDHHLADVRGYAYEHRLVAEIVLGRRLRRGEVVHHRDGDKANNNPENLEVLTRAQHGAEHANKITNDIRDIIGYFPSTRPALAELTGLPGRQVGWILSRLRRKGCAVRNSVGSWIGTGAA